MIKELEEKIKSEIVVMPNFETDSTSIEISEADYMQQVINDQHYLQNPQIINQSTNKPNETQPVTDEQLLDMPMSNFPDENNIIQTNNPNFLSTDSTSIDDLSAIQPQNESTDNFYVNDNTDSTTLESSEIQSDSLFNSKPLPYRKKPIKVMIDSKNRKNANNITQEDFLFSRPENNLRTKEKRKNLFSSEISNNSNSPRKSFYSSNLSSGRSAYRGMYDPLHLRPTMSKQQKGFEPIPMEKPKIENDSKSLHDSIISKSSKNSIESNQIKRNKQNNSPPVLISSSGMPTPISGFVVTDSNPSPHHIKLEFSDDPIVEAMQRLVEYGEIPPEDIRNQVVYMLKREGVTAMVNEEYDKAKKMEDAQKFLKDFLEADFTQKKSEMAQKSIETKLRTAQNELEIESREWDDLYRSYIERQENERQNLLERHRNEQKTYNEKWTEPSMLIPFNKPSSQLIQMRKIQKNLAMIKNFNEAKEVKLRADELQKKETKEAEKRIKQAIWTGYQTLLEKQKREIECFNEHTRRSCDYITLKKQELLEPIQKLIKSLKKGYPCFYITEDLAESRNKYFSANSATKSKTLPNPKKKPLQATPRTKQTLTEFRREGEPSKLNISSIQIKEYVHAKRAASYKVSRKPK